MHRSRGLFLRKHVGSASQQRSINVRCCWAHARRTIYDVSKENPHRVKLLEMIQGLYDVNAREQGMDVEARWSIVRSMRYRSWR